MNKRLLLVIALAAVMVFAGASLAFAKTGGSKIAAISGKALPDGWNNLGYINWTTSTGNTTEWWTALSAGSLTTEQDEGPHAGYTTTTVKCAVCHSVHLAPANSFLLTKVTASVSGSGEAICRYCHYDANTVGITAVAFSLTAAPMQHSDKCSKSDGTGCHAGPHGVGASHYETLASALLGSSGDANIAAGITATTDTGLTSADFTLNSPPSGDQRTLRVAYTCGKPGCHNNSAFVSKPGKGMSVGTPGGSTSSGYYSAHPMLGAAATVGGNTNGTYTGQVAWANSAGIQGVGTAPNTRGYSACATCHDLKDPNVSTISCFPHDRFNKSNGIWLTAADYFGATSYSVSNHEFDPTPSVGTSTGAPYAVAAATEYGFSTLRDGVCLKCHRGSATSGVGLTF